MIVCGRSLGKLQAFIGASQIADRLSLAQIDRDRATAEEIAALDAFCVVDAAGPFQAQDLRFPRAVIDAKCHYVDFADARDFVAAFASLDAQATAHGVLAVTGASSTPALSHAVLDDITRGWRRVDAVEIAISPGGGTSFGLSVFKAILSYVGQPLRVWRHGRWETAPGWGLTVRRTIGGVGKRWLSLCETPDLDLVLARFPRVRSAAFRAGLELSLLHWGLWALSLVVRFRLMRSLVSLAEPLRAAAELTRPFGGAVGGMLVKASGVAGDGAHSRVTWSLAAKGGDGPQIPALPALCVVRALVDGSLTQRGATACVGLVELGALEREFKRFAITTERGTQRFDATPLFQSALEGFGRMPASVRAAHTPNLACDLQGRVEIDGAAHWVGRAVAWTFGFPASARDAPALVTIEREDEGEVWIRRFGETEFRSHLRAGAQANRLVERFGALTFDLDARADEAGFELSIIGARAFGIPLPRALAPTTQARASADANGRYCFDVLIALPVVGRLVRYRGTLEQRA